MKPLNLGSVDKIPLGQGQCFVVGGKEIAVFRPRSGELFAMDNRCPHRNAPLCEGLLDNQHVICPFHGHQFDLRTGRGAEAGETVSTYVAIEKNGDVLVVFPV